MLKIYSFIANMLKRSLEKLSYNDNRESLNFQIIIMFTYL